MPDASATGRRPGRQPAEVRVVIVEDHPAIAQGLAAVLGGASPIHVVGVAGDVIAGSDLIAQQQPDVVLCDVMLGARDAGFDLLRIHGMGSRFVMYSAYDFPAHHARALEEGARGYLPKTADTDTVVQALLRVAAGGRWYPADVLESARTAAKTPTRRERELLVQLAEGASNDDLAQRLGVRVKTIEGMLRRLFDRYGVDNRTQLVRFALRQGWLDGVSGGRAR